MNTLQTFEAVSDPDFVLNAQGDPDLVSSHNIR